MFALQKTLVDIFLNLYGDLALEKDASFSLTADEVFLLTVHLLLTAGER